MFESNPYNYIQKLSFLQIIIKQYIIQINNLKQINKKEQQKLLNKTLMNRLANGHRASTHATIIKIAILDITTALTVTSFTPKDVLFIIRYVCSG